MGISTDDHPDSEQVPEWTAGLLHIEGFARHPGLRQLSNDEIRAKLTAVEHNLADDEAVYGRMPSRQEVRDLLRSQRETIRGYRRCLELRGCS